MLHTEAIFDGIREYREEAVLRITRYRRRGIASALAPMRLGLAGWDALAVCSAHPTARVLRSAWAVCWVVLAFAPRCLIIGAYSPRKSRLVSLSVFAFYWLTLLVQQVPWSEC